MVELGDNGARDPMTLSGSTPMKKGPACSVFRRLNTSLREGGKIGILIVYLINHREMEYTVVEHSRPFFKILSFNSSFPKSSDLKSHHPPLVFSPPPITVAKKYLSSLGYLSFSKEKKIFLKSFSSFFTFMPRVWEYNGFSNENKNI